MERQSRLCLPRLASVISGVEVCVEKDEKRGENAKIIVRGMLRKALTSAHTVRKYEKSKWLKSLTR